MHEILIFVSVYAICGIACGIAMWDEGDQERAILADITGGALWPLVVLIAIFDRIINRR